MAEIKLRLFEHYEPGNQIVPLSGILSRPKSSQQTRLVPGLLLEEEPFVETIHNDGTNIYTTSFSFPQYTNYTAGDFQSDLIIGSDPHRNVYVDLPFKSVPEPNIRLTYLDGAQSLTEFSIQFKQADSSYADSPDTTITDGHDIRIFLYDEDVAKGPLRVTATKYGSDGLQYNYSTLLPDVNVLHTDWTLSAAGTLVVTVNPGCAAYDADALTIKSSALSRPDIYIPTTYWNKPWYPLIRIGSVVQRTHIVSTRKVAAANVHPGYMQYDDKALVVSNLIYLAHRDIVADSAKITIYLNGKAQDNTGLIRSINSRFGIIELTKHIPSTTGCSVKYEIDHTQWIEASSVDYNPQYGHHMHRAERAEDVSVKYWIQPLQYGGELVYTVSSSPGIGYTESRGSREAFHSSWKSLATLSTLPFAMPDLVDISQPGGGITEDQRSQCDARSLVNMGFFDGEPVDVNTILVRIPQATYDKILSAYAGDSEKTDAYISNAVRQFAAAGINIIIEQKA